jgi:hypothetical protein
VQTSPALIALPKPMYYNKPNFEPFLVIITTLTVVYTKLLSLLFELSLAILGRWRTF